MNSLEKAKGPRDFNVIATEINIIKEQTNKVLLSSAIEIGKRLKEAKELAGHGNWSKWLEEEVHYSQRTATNLMRLYDEYGPKLLENQIGNPIADLGYTQAIAMLKLDFEERENFVAEHDIEVMSVKELEEAIKEKIALKEEKTALLKQLEEQAEKESQLAKELQEKVAKIEHFEELVREKTEEARKLKEHAQSKAADKNHNPEEIKKLQDAFEEKVKRIEELKKQLSEKPKEIEVEVERYIEVVPLHIEKEIEQLKRDLSQANAKQSTSESATKFKLTFDHVVNMFNELLSCLDGIQREVPEEYDKYKLATNKFLEKLMIKD